MYTAQQSESVQSSSTRDKNWDCMICDKKFKSVQLRNEHEMGTHFFDFVCCYDDCMFALKSSYKLKVNHSSRAKMLAHINTQHRDHMMHGGAVKQTLRTFACIVCKKNFPTKRFMISHVYTVHFADGRQCAVEGCDFNPGKNRFFHAMRHYKTKHLGFRICQYCSIDFETEEECREHRRTCVRKRERQEKKFKCTEPGCDYTSQLREAVNNHYRSMHSDIVLSCDQCDFKSSNQSSLYRHKKTIHASEKRHKCDECGMMFTQKCSVSRHMRTAHPEKATPATCDPSKKQKMKKPVNRSRKKYFHREPRPGQADCKKKAEGRVKGKSGRVVGGKRRKRAAAEYVESETDSDHTVSISGVSESDGSVGLDISSETSYKVGEETEAPSDVIQKRSRSCRTKTKARLTDAIRGSATRRKGRNKAEVITTGQDSTSLFTAEKSEPKSVGKNGEDKSQIQSSNSRRQKGSSTKSRTASTSNKSCATGSKRKSAVADALSSPREKRARNTASGVSGDSAQTTTNNNKRQKNTKQKSSSRKTSKR